MNVASRAAYRPAQRPASRLTGRGGGGGLTGYITINGELSGAVDEGDTLTLAFVDTSMLGTITGGDNISEGDSLVLEFEPVTIESQAWDKDGVAFDPAETGLELTVTDVQFDDWNGSTAGITVTYSNGQTKRFTKVVSIAIDAPTVSTQPTTQTVTPGTEVTLTSTATGSGTIVGQWQVNDGASWEDIPGELSDNYVFTASLGDDGKQYRRAFTNQGGTTNSNAATLTVEVEGVTITTQPQSQTVEAGSTGTFTSEYTPESATSQWQELVQVET